jgi:hypothetical protein
MATVAGERRGTDHDGNLPAGTVVQESRAQR